MAKIKGSSRVVWMGDDEITMLQNIAQAVDLPQTQVMSRIVAAGLRCITENKNEMPLPLRFELKRPGGERGGLEQISHAEERHPKVRYKQ